MAVDALHGAHADPQHAVVLRHQVHAALLRPAEHHPRARHRVRQAARGVVLVDVVALGDEQRDGTRIASRARPGAARFHGLLLKPQQVLAGEAAALGPRPRRPAGRA